MSLLTSTINRCMINGSRNAVSNKLFKNASAFTMIRTFSKSYKTPTTKSLLLSAQKRSNVGISNYNFKQTLSKRNYSVIEEESAAPIIGFEEMQSIAAKPSPDQVIVDVREPGEYAAGHIPGAINVPVKSSPGALGLSEDEFQLTFGIPKPELDKTLIFYCLAGVRSSMAEELAGTFGYDKRLNYVGSWEDWVANNGKIEGGSEKE
ncbi:hypothetical protein CANARDRAFT_26590 [[Candida] arabinofermentans NRRL YB-2248]|uniref:Rhodanese domain-containing protein n=1 Tax=[Candida] arabinofermentans NRRL YB-2248 TaxID=983967 RepID=A0A1E4T5Z4_9ASCO|nr:hypothetical protein CANARDRAFT_26590 [[Candida] arabinofermentans NRRL YB-2248]